MITVVLADDHPIVRQGLRTLLETNDGCQVIGEAADGLTAITLILDLQPALAVLDLQMPDLHGLEVARRAREKSPRTRVIVLSMHGDEPYVLEALQHGVMGYVLKGSATTDLSAAVHAVMAGQRFLSARLRERGIGVDGERTGVTPRPLDRYELLTGREREVLQLAAQGMNAGEIGARLAISPRTAETHRANLLRKLGLITQTDLVRYAIGRGQLAEHG